MQCNYIKQRINVIQVLPYELQEVGLKKWEFSETLVAKMWEEPQPPLRGMFGKKHFGHLEDIDYLMEEDLMCMKKSKLRKFQFQWRIWLAWYCWLVSCLEENVKFDKFLMRYISNVLTSGLYFRNKMSIYNFFNMLFTNIWYSFSWIYVEYSMK